MADWLARTPILWPAAVGWWWRSRYRAVLSASMGLLADDANAQIVHPFLDATVLGAVAGHFGPAGPSDRSAAMTALFGDVLPADVLSRRSKAYFDEAFISEHSRSFVPAGRARGWTRRWSIPTVSPTSGDRSTRTPGRCC